MLYFNPNGRKSAEGKTKLHLSKCFNVAMQQKYCYIHNVDVQMNIHICMYICMYIYQRTCIDGICVGDIELFSELTNRALTEIEPYYRYCTADRRIP
jgi:hypothetical protein